MKTIQYFFMIGMIVITLYGDYIQDSSNKRVYDTTTNIMWSDHNATSDTNATTFTWIEAFNYCENLDLNGSDDWHLPNFNQLFLLADRSKNNPSIDSAFINIYNTGLYWSSTTNMQNQSQALVVNFYDGTSERKAKIETAYLRCFREWN